MSLAVDAGTHTVYVANGDATLSVVDATTRAVRRTWSLSGAADHVAVDPSTHQIFVSALGVPGPYRDHEVQFFDGATFDEPFLYSAPGVGESSLAVDPAAHRIFIAQAGVDPGGSYVLTSFDTVTYRWALFRSRVQSTGVAFDSTAQRLYAVDGGAGTVSVFYVAEPNRAVSTINVGSTPMGIAVDPVTHTVYVPNSGSHSVSVINALTNTVTATVAVGSSPSGVAIDPSTHAVYVTDSVANTLTTIDGITHTITATTAVGPQPNSVAVDPSTHTVWVTTSGNNALTVLDPVVVRLAGPDRFATAAAISAAQFSDGQAGGVVLARSDTYPDALVGAPLAAAKNAPLLFASGPTLPAATKSEILRVLPPGKPVYLLGGITSIPDSVATQLSGLGYLPVRVGGVNRFATAVAVADTIGDPSTVLLADGGGFPDALAAGPAAAHAGGAVLLTAGGTMPPETSAYLAAHPGTVYAIGGPAAVADTAATPIAGADRYATAAAVARTFFPTVTHVGLASGAAFSDALASGAFVAHTDAPLLLTDPALLPASTRSYLVGAVTSATIFGGEAAISQAVDTSVLTAISH